MLKLKLLYIKYLINKRKKILAEQGSNSKLIQLDIKLSILKFGYGYTNKNK